MGPLGAVHDQRQEVGVQEEYGTRSRDGTGVRQVSRRGDEQEVRLESEPGQRRR